MRKSRTILSILFVSPAIIIIGLIVIYPFFYNIIISFFNTDIFEPANNYFIGVNNYLYNFKYGSFIKALLNTLILTFSSTVIQIIIATVIAIILNVKMRGRGIIRSMYLMPWTIGAYVAAYIIRWMFDLNFGIFNQLLALFSLVEKGIPWFTSPNLAMLSVIGAHVWKGLPWSTIVILAGLQMISNDAIEASRVDGANYWQEFRYIVFPMIRYVYMVVFILRVIWDFNWFDFVWLLTSGGPSDRTLTLPIHVYKTAFLVHDAGKASAVGVIMLIFLIIFVFIFLKVSSTEGESL